MLHKSFESLMPTGKVSQASIEELSIECLVNTSMSIVKQNKFNDISKQITNTLGEIKDLMDLNKQIKVHGCDEALVCYMRNSGLEKKLGVTSKDIFGRTPSGLKDVYVTNIFATIGNAIAYLWKKLMDLVRWILDNIHSVQREVSNVMNHKDKEATDAIKRINSNPKLKADVISKLDEIVDIKFILEAEDILTKYAEEISKLDIPDIENVFSNIVLKPAIAKNDMLIEPINTIAKFIERHGNDIITLSADKKSVVISGLKMRPVQDSDKNVDMHLYNRVDEVLKKATDSMMKNMYDKASRFHKFLEDKNKDPKFAAYLNSQDDLIADTMRTLITNLTADASELFGLLSSSVTEYRKFDIALQQFRLKVSQLSTASMNEQK